MEYRLQQRDDAQNQKMALAFEIPSDRFIHEAICAREREFILANEEYLRSNLGHIMAIETSIYDEIDQATEDAADAEGLAQAAAGRLVPHGDVAAWLDTWGTPGFKPAPVAWFK